jgi:hypothetical protein
MRTGVSPWAEAAKAAAAAAAPPVDQTPAVAGFGAAMTMVGWCTL